MYALFKKSTTKQSELILLSLVTVLRLKKKKKPNKHKENPTSPFKKPKPQNPPSTVNIFCTSQP